MAAALAAALLPMAAAASEPFYVQVTLGGKGIPDGTAFTLEVLPEWAPVGAARFRTLVEAAFYDDTRFFRVLDGMYDIYIAQFGIGATPAIHERWGAPVRDDPVKASNVRGTLSFAMSGPNTRTTQLFLNTGDSSKVLDGDFAPIARVVSGIEAIDKIYVVGEGSPKGKGPQQHQITTQGNAYLDREFPDLTRVVSARLVDAPPDVAREL